MPCGTERLQKVADGIARLPLDRLILTLANFQCQRETRGMMASGPNGLAIPICKSKGHYARACLFKDMYDLIYNRLGEAIEERKG